MKLNHKVIFERPAPMSYAALGLNAVDMHVHTEFSDSMSKVKDILRIAKERKVGIGIADHNEIKGVLKSYKNVDNIMVIPGIEVSAGDGPHLLFYFYSVKELSEFFEKYVKPNRPKNPNLAITLASEELFDYSKEFNCIRTAAHPFGYGFTNTGIMKCVGQNSIPKRVMKKVDAMEVICGAIPHASNLKSTMYALDNNKGITAGTDSHVIDTIGGVVTVSESENSVERFLDNIKNKTNMVVGKESIAVKKVRPGLGIGAKHMRYPLATLLTQIKTHGRKAKAKVKNKIKI